MRCAVAAGHHSMRQVRQVLFVQGGGARTHDDWDAALVASLRAELGDGFEVRYPRMPDEDDPSAASWGEAIRAEVEALAPGAVVVGHSVGGTLLVHVLTSRPVAVELGAVVLLSAPFVGPGGWPGEDFELAGDLGARLPPGADVHVVHGLEDDVVPASHAELHRRAIGRAQLHLLPGRDHQLGGDLREVARMIAPAGPTP